MQYGTPEQVEAQRKAKEQMSAVVEMSEDDPDIVEAKRLAEEKAKK